MMKLDPCREREREIFKIGKVVNGCRGGRSLKTILYLENWPVNSPGERQIKQIKYYLQKYSIGNAIYKG